jgi:hypothetical protein
MVVRSCKRQDPRLLAKSRRREQVMHVDTAGSVLADVPVRNSCRKRPFPQQTDRQLS